MMPGKRGTPPRWDRSASVRDRRRGGAGWPDARGSKDDAHRGQLALDPAVAPGGVLPGQSTGDRHRAGRDARSTWAAGIGPFPPDQVPVPAEQGLRLHEEPTSTSSVHESTQPGEQGSILRLQGRPDHLATEHSHLVTEHDYLDGQIITVLAPQPVQLKDPDEREVEERQGHGPVSRFTDESRKGWSRYPNDILGTHTFSTDIGIRSHGAEYWARLASIPSGSGTGGIQVPGKFALNATVPSRPGAASAVVRARRW
jgi:hypothetical protein